jgi:hypothetical protein
MPLITLRTDVPGSDGREEVMTEYFCDWPDCPNVAVHVLGVIREVRAAAMVCAEHHPDVVAARARAKRTPPEK